MKLGTCIVVGLLIISGSTAMGMEKNEMQKTKTIEKFFSQPIIKTINSHVEIQIPEANTYLYYPGKPLLPAYTATYTFPFGTKIVKLECTIDSTETILLDNKVLATPQPLLITRVQKNLIHSENTQLYTSDQHYPNNWYNYIVSAGLDENNQHVTFLTLRIYPVRYNPIENKLVYLEDITFTLTYKEPEENPFPETRVYDMVIITPLKFSPYLLPLVKHKESVGIKTTIKTINEIYNVYHGVDRCEQIKYFIKDAIETWDIKYVLLVGGLNSIIYGNSRDDRNQGFSTWNFPTRYTNLYDSGEIFDPGFLSDLYFADIYDCNGNFSSWDTNNDGLFADWSAPEHEDIRMQPLPHPIGDEECDILDFYPDVYIGRLPCRNSLEVLLMVQKIIEYEKEPVDPTWYNRLLVVGGDPYNDIGTDYIEGELICEKVISYMQGFEPIKLYASNKNINESYTPLTENIIREINQGCGFLFLDGHATPASWNTYWPGYFSELIPDGGISIYDFSKLNNKGKLPICVIGGCHSSQFNVSLLPTILDWDNSKYYWSYGQPIPECWSWWFTRKLNSGAIATIGSTGLGYEAGGEHGDLDGDGINDPDCIEALGGYLETLFFKNIYENSSHLGEAWGKAITQYLEVFPGMGNQSDAKTIEQWVLIGDPSLKIGGYQ